MEELNLLIQLKKDMINKFKFYIFLTSFITVTFNILASNINITGLSKLNINDLQTQTFINLNKDFYTDDEINTLLNPKNMDLCTFTTNGHPMYLPDYKCYINKYKQTLIFFGKRTELRQNL